MDVVALLASAARWCAGTQVSRAFTLSRVPGPSSPLSLAALALPARLSRSGKSWSMGGSDEQPGIIPRMIGDLFAHMREAKAAGGAPAAAAEGPEPAAAAAAAGSPPDRAPPSSPDFQVTAPLPPARPPPDFQVTASYLELYNEVVKDLLNPSDRQLAIREHPKLGVYVQGLAEIVVACEADVLRLLEQGARVRHVAATQMNERSSRSHSIFTLRIEQRTVTSGGGRQTTRTVSSRINLVDLAGSERAAKTGATGDVLKQGAAINKVRWWCGGVWLRVGVGLRRAAAGLRVAGGVRNCGYSREPGKTDLPSPPLHPANSACSPPSPCPLAVSFGSGQLHLRTGGRGRGRGPEARAVPRLEAHPPAAGLPGRQRADGDGVRPQSSRRQVCGGGGGGAFRESARWCQRAGWDPAPPQPDHTPTSTSPRPHPRHALTRSYDETLSTLHYASRASAIKNVVTRNEDSSEVLIRALRDEIEALRRALAAAQGGSAGGAGGGEDAGGGASDSQRAAMEETLAALERAKAQSWEERERLSAAWEAERAKNLANEARIGAVMATLREEHAGLLARLRALVQEREGLERAHRRARRAHREA